MTERAAHRLDFSKKLLLGGAGLAALTVPIVSGIGNATQTRAQSQAQGRVDQTKQSWE